MANLPGVKQAQVRALPNAKAPVSRLHVGYGSAHVSAGRLCKEKLRGVAQLLAWAVLATTSPHKYEALNTV